MPEGNFVLLHVIKSLKWGPLDFSGLGCAQVGLLLED